MKNCLARKPSNPIKFSLLLPFLISFSAHSATFETKENIGTAEFNQIEDFSRYETIESTQNQQIEQVNKNYLQVIQLLKKKQFSKAKTKVLSLIQQNPNQAIYHNLQALLQLLDKDLTGAEKSFLIAIGLDENNIQALTGLAKLAQQNEQFEQAVHYANTALALNPYVISAYNVLIDITMQQQGIDAVESLLQDAHVKVKNNLKAELAIIQSLGKLYITKKQPEKLLQIAQDLVNRNTQETSALSLLAEAQLINQDDSGAELTLRQIITQHPKDTKHLFLLARLLGKQQGKETEILSLLDKAALNSDTPATLLSYKTTVLIKQKRLQEALSIAQHIEDTYPTQSTGIILKGDIFLAEKKYQNALENYQLAYTSSPNTHVLDAMLKILTIQNQHHEAITLLESEFKKHKDNMAIQYRLAVTYQNQGQLDLSKKHYEALLIKQKDNVIVLNNLALIYSQQHNAKAIATAKQAYKLAPKSGVVADTYGYILLKHGNKSESLKVLKLAVELDSKVTEIQLHLAEAYIANQLKPEAKDILQRLQNKQGVEKEQVMTLMKQL